MICESFKINDLLGPARLKLPANSPLLGHHSQCFMLHMAKPDNMMKVKLKYKHARLWAAEVEEALVTFQILNSIAAFAAKAQRHAQLSPVKLAKACMHRRSHVHSHEPAQRGAEVALESGLELPSQECQEVGAVLPIQVTMGVSWAQAWKAVLSLLPAAAAGISQTASCLLRSCLATTQQTSKCTPLRM
jgi:hypothetical protein